MSETKKIVITKVGKDEHKTEHKTEPKQHHKLEHKTEKKPLKSILKKTAKIRDVKDPAKASPLKPGMKKHSLKMFTNKGFKKHDRTLRKKLKKEKFKEYLQNPELKLNPKTPSSLAKKIIGNAISAGFIS
jgi:hypothetical protein